MGRCIALLPADRATAIEPTTPLTAERRMLDVTDARCTIARWRVTSIAAAMLAAGALPARAQVYASEHGLVAQTVNGTTMTVEYYRPEARGRELFGRVVRWGQVWTPGANWATTFDVDHDVRIEGQALPRGKYSIWTIPNADEWTIIFQRTARAFHTVKPPAEDEQLRVKVKPGVGAQTEVLTWSFPVVRAGPELHLQWGTTDVALHVGIGPATAAIVLGPQERAAYVGTYTMKYTDVRRAGRPAMTVVVFDSAGVLRFHRDQAPDQLYDAQYDLHPTGVHTFVPIMYKNGALVGVEPAVAVVFTVEGGRATGYEIRGVGGNLTMARATLEKP
jgi:hypothetical protein